MKILHVIPSVSTLRGGPSQAVIEMVSQLRQQGVDAEIVTTNDSGPELLDVPLNCWTQQYGVPIQFFSRFSPKINSVREFAFSLSLTTWLIKHVKNYDLIHIHAIFSFPSTVAMVIARSQGVPYVVRPLGQLCEWSLQQSQLKKRLYLKAIERANLNASSGLHLTSASEREDAEKLQLDCSSFVIPHGLAFSPTLQNARQQLRGKFGLPEDEKIVLFLSRIHPKKGLDYLIPALSCLKDHSFTFILAGSGDAAYESEVRSLLQTLGLKTRTIMPGFVEGKAKDLLLQGSDIYALTSHSENFGVAVLEALAAGIPTIVTPGVALAEEINYHQLGYVSELNQQAITQTFRNCLHNLETARQTGKRAQQFVFENYTWKNNADILTQTYNKSISTVTPQSPRRNNAVDSYIQRST